MLLAEELVLVAIRPSTGRHQLGAGEGLNACLAGLLVAELLLDGVVGSGGRADRIVVAAGRPAPSSPTLAAAARVVAEKGPRMKAVLSHMSRGLQRELGLSTLEAAVSGLTDAGILGPATGGLMSRHPLIDVAARDEIVLRLQAAADGDGATEPRTALVLSMTGPGRLLEVVAPHRGTRTHARNRIDHALDDSNLESVGKVVRRLIQEAAAAASAATIAGGAAAIGSS